MAIFIVRRMREGICKWMWLRIYELGAEGVDRLGKVRDFHRFRPERG